jgi:hypothetical protein
MGFDVAPHPGQHVRQLVTHAGRLRREAREALRQGDHARAALLIEQAELLAADVGALVDAMEQRQTSEFVQLAAEHHAAMARRRKPLLGPRSRRIGVALGASLAAGLALVEW